MCRTQDLSLHPRGDMERLYRQVEREHHHAREQQLLQSSQPVPAEQLIPPGELDLNVSSSGGSSVTVKFEPKHEPFDQQEEQPVDVVLHQLPEVKAEQGELPPAPSKRRRRSQPERLGCQPDWFEDSSSDDDRTPSKKPRNAFVCDFCEQMFPFRSKLDRHVKNSHTGQTVRCPFPQCLSRILLESLERHWKGAHSAAGIVSVPASFSLCGACGLRTVQDCGCVGNARLQVEELVSLLAAALEVPHTWWVLNICNVEN